MKVSSILSPGHDQAPSGKHLFLLCTSLLFVSLLIL